jgi:site-specific recombinase XerD
VIARLSHSPPVTSMRIYEILVDAFTRCAAWVAHQDPRAAQRIRQATTHWLRHTYGSHGVAFGMPTDVLQANLGHASLATTSIYVTAEKARRHAAVRLAFNRKG